VYEAPIVDPENPSHSIILHTLDCESFILMAEQTTIAFSADIPEPRPVGRGREAIYKINYYMAIMPVNYKKAPFREVSWGH